MTPRLVVLAGPNGAGKSTFYDAFLAGSPLPFLNADLFAARTGVEALEALKILDRARDRMIEQELSFITETVFSDPYRRKLGMLEKAMTAGYDVTLVYIGLASAELAARRVDRRVRIGGHNVPRDRIAPRFRRSLANLRAAIPLVTTAELYDNSSADNPYRHLATFRAAALTWRMQGAPPAWARGLVTRARRQR
jgi:predicted ABC-type ATPase